MKKILAGLLACLLVLGMVAFAETGDKEYDVVFIPKSVHEFYNLIKSGVDQAIADLAEEGIKINLTWSAADKADSVKQAEMLEAAIALKPDCIAIAVIDGEMCKDLMQQALDQGISVYGFDTDFPDSPRQGFVGAGMENQYKCGYDTATMMIEAIGDENCEVAILAGSPAAENHKRIVKGFEDCIAENYPNVKIVTKQADNDKVEEATNITESILSQYPNIRGIFGATSGDGLGASYAYESAIEAGKFEVGDVIIIDHTLTAEKKNERIPQGYLYGVLDAPPYVMGYYAIQMINAYLTNGTPYQDIYLTYEKVDASNLETFTNDYTDKAADLEYWH